MRSAELARQREARLDQIHGDDGAGPDQFCRHDRAQSDRAGAEDDNGIIDVDVPQSDEGSVSCTDAAAGYRFPNALPRSQNASAAAQSFEPDAFPGPRPGNGS
jgi:hypothetical protein